MAIPRSLPLGATKNGPGAGNGRFGGNTDLDELDALGMWVALSFERGRLRRSGLPEADIFNAENPVSVKHALVFNVSKPELVETARSKSAEFSAAMTWLHQNFGVVPDWPGFDILTLDPREPNSCGPYDRAQVVGCGVTHSGNDLERVENCEGEHSPRAVLPLSRR